MMPSSNNPGGRSAAPGSTTPESAQWDWAELEPGEGAIGSADRQRSDVEDAHRRGMEAGKAEMATAMRKELASAMAATLRAADEIKVSRDAWTRALEENLVVLAAGMARHVLDRAIEIDPGILAALAKRAVAAFPEDEELRIRVNPSDHERLTEGAGLLVESVGGRDAVRWIPDESVGIGGCIVEGPDKIVDGRLDEALNRVVRTLSNG